jgi:hypothetical protein
VVVPARQTTKAGGLILKPYARVDFIRPQSRTKNLASLFAGGSSETEAEDNVRARVPELGQIRSRIHERAISMRVSGHNLEISQTCCVRTQCFHYKLVSNHFSSGGGGGE